MTRSRTVIGVLVSLLYLILVGVLSWSKREVLFELAPNAVGDFLAGIFGPLAVLWLILGYFQQGEELKQSTEALRLQAEELRNSVAQQQALVDVSRKQFESQTAALDHERQNQKMARSPVFSIRSDGDGVIHGNEKTYPFVLHNFGAPVNRVEIAYEGGGHRRTGFKLDSLSQRAPYRFEIFDQRHKPEGATIRIGYVDSGGQRGASTFNLQFHLSRQNQETTVRIEQVES
ncbi:hypothetical protein [Achromobacter mucicolens]|uniref:hypothetical protein n=1 Tax=Achromobacter mucicolens TaxID=1389922 RepID=UPI001CBFF0A1|nr:hypothetical protein [Achromobacter mucicolens]UAN03038.1 hypothetical protein K9D24_02325 [Achromobacter mucicolens]